jgi:hypothetical protein
MCTGPDGQKVWWNPPEGCQVGEPLSSAPEGMFTVVLTRRGGLGQRQIG